MQQGVRLLMGEAPGAASGLEEKRERMGVRW
jgi:hypothetical protein